MSYNSNVEVPEAEAEVLESRIAKTIDNEDNSKSKQNMVQFASDAVKHFSGELYRFLVRRTHRRHEDVEDLVQEVYIRLLRANAKDLIRNPRAYILQTACHVAHDFTGKDHRHKEFVIVDSEIMDAVAEYPTEILKDNIATRLNTIQQLNSVLEKLQPMHRAVLLMYYREGYTYKEISPLLGISLDQVERYLAAAKQYIMSFDWDIK